MASVENEISHKTRTGAMLGTPLYMSPEQCLGVKEVDHRTDIYSLGCILHEMLCGTPPFNSEGFGALVNMHINEPPPRASKQRPDIPAGVERIILRMLAKKAEDRFQTMLAVQQALAPELARAPMPRPSELGAATLAGSTVRELRNATTLSAASGSPGTEPGPGPRRGVRLGIAAALLLGAGGVALVMLRPHAPPPSPPPVAAAPTPPAAVAPPDKPLPPPPPPAPALIEAQLDSTPHGALVSVGGVAIGTTPMTWRTAPSDHPTTLTFALDGYKTEVIPALPSSSLRLAPALRRLEERHARKRPAPPDHPGRPTMPTDDIKSER